MRYLSKKSAVKRAIYGNPSGGSEKKPKGNATIADAPTRLSTSPWIISFPFPEGVKVPKAIWYPAAKNVTIAKSICCPWSGKNTFKGWKGIPKWLKFD
jgi:hypothetical protein